MKIKFSQNLKIILNRKRYKHLEDNIWKQEDNLMEIMFLAYLMKQYE